MPRLNTPACRRARQRGVTTLVAALVLLFVAALGLLYSHRGLLADQHLAARQTEAALADERAEAGLDWAIGQLNAPQGIGPDCRPAVEAGQASFRQRYWMATPANAGALRPACGIDPASGALHCRCPGLSTTATLPAASAHPGFAVALSTVSGDADAVQLSAWACEADGCAAPPATPPRRSVRLKLASTPRAPMAALSCGGDCRIGAAAALSNTDAASRGLLVNAGGAIDITAGATLTTLPGRPAAAALVPRDASLRTTDGAPAADDCTGTALFRAHFGMDLARFAALPATRTIRCRSAADCQSAIDTAVAQGWRWFDVTSPLPLPAHAVLGSRRDPLVLVARQGVHSEGRVEFNGLLVTGGPVSAAASAGADAALSVRGAQLSCGSAQLATGSVAHDAQLLRDARRAGATLLRVPGSWRDARGERGTTS